MNLNHLDLQVPDVPAAAELFERLFDLKIQSNRTSPAICILADDSGFTLVLQRKKRVDEAYPEGFHIGFVVDSPDTVRAQHARVLAAGLPSSDIIENNRGVMFYATGPGDITIEVSCRRVRERS